MSQVTLEFVFRRQCSLKDLIALLTEKAKTLTVGSSKETADGHSYSLAHKKYPGEIQLCESMDGVITGHLVKGDMILGAFVDWIGRNGKNVVYGLDIRFRN